MCGSERRSRELSIQAPLDRHQLPSRILESFRTIYQVSLSLQSGTNPFCSVHHLHGCRAPNLELRPHDGAFHLCFSSKGSTSVLYASSFRLRRSASLARLHRRSARLDRSWSRQFLQRLSMVRLPCTGHIYYPSNEADKGRSNRSPDGSSVLTVGEDRTMRVFQLSVALHFFSEMAFIC